jgi:subtilisin family serine protease
LPDPVRIGVVDGPVDSLVPALSSVRIESHSVLAAGQTPAPPDHGTGVVSLIAGRASAGATPGLAQGAHVLSAVAFAETSDGNLASTDGLASALDWLATRDAQVINLSLAGPSNQALGAVLGALADRDVVLVAATGNDGRIGVAYPASDPHVIGISAIDARRRLYAEANRGEEVDFVAPGVEVLVALEGRPAYRTGTSFAAAIATAVIAHSLSRVSVSPATLSKRLRDGSEDLGQPGHDTDFGWGLLKLPECHTK